MGLDHPSQLSVAASPRLLRRSSSQIMYLARKPFKLLKLQPSVQSFHTISVKLHNPQQSTSQIMSLRRRPLNSPLTAQSLQSISIRPHIIRFNHPGNDQQMNRNQRDKRNSTLREYMINHKLRGQVYGQAEYQAKQACVLKNS